MIEFIEVKNKMTAQEYLVRERATLRENGGKHEFFNGKLIEMAGASYNHNRIAKNAALSMERQFEQHNTDHEATLSDTKVPSFLKGKNFFYPDVVIVEGKPIYVDEFEDIVANPQILIEVLSESTESFDRGDKFQAYQKIKYLQEYILISSDKRRIEQFYKDENGDWQTGKVVSEGYLSLKTVPFELIIEDMYRKIQF